MTAHFEGARSIPAVMLCVGATLAAACDHRSASQPASAAGDRPPSLLTAIGEQLAVVDSADGQTRYLPGRFTEVSRVAVTAGGEFAIVVNGARDCRTQGGFEEGSYQPEIDHVEIATGARERVVGGSDFPVVNRRAVTLAGIGVSDAPALVAYEIVCDGGGTLGFTDMVTGLNARRPPLGETGYTSELPVESVRPLGWLSDGRTLFYMVSVRAEPGARYYFGLVWPLVETSDEVIRRVADTMPLSGDVPTAAALVDDTTIAFAQHAGAGGSRVRGWDVTTGQFRQSGQLFELPETITALTIDAGGRHFLAITRPRRLYRWSVGDPRPVKIADGVTAAAWIQ